ncbi:MAG: FHA domain-containing protein [Leptolyngbyaceae cyanobacterium bins.349]|nr:FHA domain-containing protein [Leptolyngbyaceae cyanobacterium bins.349]
MQSIPVQSWNFEHESVIRIGRSTDNHVILYSAVVSRHHVEIRKADQGWEIVNLGANGTYLDGKRITQVPVSDGVIIRLARSGPNVQIHLSSSALDAAHALVGEKTIGQGQPASDTAIHHQTNIPDFATAVPANAPPRSGFSRQTMVDAEEAEAINALPPALELAECCHQYVNSEHLFCLECGKPLKVLATVENYHILKSLEQDEVSLAYLAWKDGQTFVLKTLLPLWMDNVEAVELFEQEARSFLTIDHPALPKFTQMLVEQGQPYLVMEPLYGRSLHQVVAREGSLSLAVAIQFMLEVCEALNYLHQQTPPILHQRIQPAHLIQRSTPAGTLMITGLTPGRTIAPLQTMAEYAAPEQQQGQALPASDLYALGPTLAYLLTGNAPDTFYAQREQGFRFYAEYVPGLTADLVALIRKLTNPQPAERFANVQEVMEALRQTHLQ